MKQKFLGKKVGGRQTLGNPEKGNLPRVELVFYEMKDLKLFKKVGKNRPHASNLNRTQCSLKNTSPLPSTFGIKWLNDEGYPRTLAIP